MNRFFLLFVFALALLQCEAQKKPTTLKVMSWNIWHGANDPALVEDGRPNAIRIIKAINPDVILMVETYGSGKMIADSLGYHFHLIAPEGTALDDKSVNLSIISRYPIEKRIDTKFPFYLGGGEITIRNQKIRILASWFHCSPWADEPEKVAPTVEKILEWEKSQGPRMPMIDSVMTYLKPLASEANVTPVVLGGDFNTPSHLDWTAATKHLHGNMVIPWNSTKALENIGMIDSYRYIHPNPVTHPGITWDLKGIKDEHRIDYIFYKGARIRVIQSEIYKAYYNEYLTLKGKKIRYPSDHGFVVTTFEIR